jgi:predicted dienelactone hydrolase
MHWKALIAVTLLQFTLGRPSPGQTNLHRLTGITVMPDRTIALEMDGGLPISFRLYFDLYIVDASSNAVDWMSLPTLLRTNNSSARSYYFDFEAPQHRLRFYRTFTNQWPTPFPTPTGPYAGTASILLTDPSRTNRYQVATNSSFMITLWYPARPQAGLLPARYIEPQLVPSLASLYGISQSVLARFCSSADAAAPVASEEAPYPVVLYSHGFRVGRSDNTAKCVELASHGYVVVAVDHADCLATVFPDGRLLTTAISSFSASSKATMTICWMTQGVFILK